MIGSGGHWRQLIGEGCPESAEIVAIGDNHARKKEAEARNGVKWDKHIAGTIYDNAGRVCMGEGSMLCAGAIIHAGAKVGKHCIINCGAVVHHDAVIGDYAHVAPGAQVLGGAKVGEGALVGANAVVLPGDMVPAWQTVRACTIWGRK